MSTARTAKGRNRKETSGQEEDVETELVEEMSDKANKGVRTKYRDLIEEVEVAQSTLEEDDDAVDLDKIRFMVLKVNDAFCEVKRPREAVLDSHLLKTIGALTKKKIESTQTNLTVFKPTEFSQKILDFMTPETSTDQHHWERFGRAVQRLYSRAVGVEPMSAALHWQRPKTVRKPRKATPKDPEAAVAEQPVKVTDAQTEEKESEVISRIYKILKQEYNKNGNRPICFFTFVVHPTSFSLTVENLFNTSLLVREQAAIVSEDRNGLPVIAPRAQSERSTGGTFNQCIFSLDMEEWQAVVTTFQITSSIIQGHIVHPRKRK